MIESNSTATARCVFNLIKIGIDIIMLIFLCLLHTQQTFNNTRNNFVYKIFGFDNSVCLTFIKTRYSCCKSLTENINFSVFSISHSINQSIQRNIKARYCGTTINKQIVHAIYNFLYQI